MYSKEQMNVITKVINEGLDPKDLLNPSYSPLHMNALYILISKQLPVTLLKPYHLSNDEIKRRVESTIKAYDISLKLKKLKEQGIKIENYEDCPIEDLAYTLLNNPMVAENIDNTYNELIEGQLELKISGDVLDEKHPIIRRIQMMIYDAHLESISIFNDRVIFKPKEIIIMSGAELDTLEAIDDIHIKRGQILKLSNEIDKELLKEVVSIEIKPHTIKIDKIQ